MWTARDNDGRLYLYEEKPCRRALDFGVSFYETKLPVKRLPDDCFPEVTFENSPKELVIKI